MLVLAGLTTGHKIGLAVVAVVFISFALSVSFLVPRRRPDFPGKNGLSVFIIVCIFLFAAMISAVAVFGRESEAKGAEAAKGTIVQVQETEFKIALGTSTVKAGPVTFVVRNAGKIQHDLAVQGGQKTPLINPGSSATLTVTLKKGTTTVYCSVPGHRKLGMVAALKVG